MGTRSLFLIRRLKKSVRDWMGQYLCGMASISTNPDLAVSMEERYKAAMVLAGAGDALGYKNGEWEFCHSGSVILEELEKLGGLADIKVKKRGWPVSDDTVMHLAVAEALTDRSNDRDREKLFSLMAQYYQDCMHDMSGRAAGVTCMTSTSRLKPNVKYGYKIPFNPRGGGCGASMRAMCIGLRYPRPEELKELVAVSVESGRMTHHHPTGYLGALASALFTAYAIQGKNPVEWASCLLDVVEKEAREYIIETKHCTRDNLNEFPYFVSAWEDYIGLRKLKTGTVEFPPNYTDPRVRDAFYKKISFGGWGGASGHDSTIIAYDALLGAGQSWEELAKRGMFHGGDSDSTGTIAACWFGAMYGFTGVPPNNYENLEYRERIEGIAKELFDLAEANKLTSSDAPPSEGSDVDKQRKKADSAQVSQGAPKIENSGSELPEAGSSTPLDSTKTDDAADVDVENDEKVQAQVNVENDNIKGEEGSGSDAMDTTEKEELKAEAVNSNDEAGNSPQTLNSAPPKVQSPTGNMVTETAL